MPNLRDFERRLANLVEGLFSKTFRSGVQPVEIAKLVLKEMDAGRTVGVSEVWAPNHFEVTTSEDDGKRFEQAQSALITELKRLIRENADERGWGLVGPPEVRLSVDPSMKKGDLAFFYLDLTSTALVRSFATDEATYLLLCQAEDREFAEVEAVFRAMTRSLLK